ncbi:MAG: alpha/beta hydrolase [Patescibacteria group bacterium]|nr:alpha/beta hydrolase [Patescibacteria group bacterium]
MIDRLMILMYFHNMNIESPKNNPGAGKKTEKAAKEIESGIKKSEGGEIEISWRKFSSESAKESEKTGRAVIFLPGWAENAGDKSLDGISQAFAEADSSSTYLISTSPEKPLKDPLETEAMAVGDFIKENKIKEIVIAGYSKGGDKAINLANLLQENNTEKIKIKGLVLMGPVGLYNQKSTELTKNFVKDIINTPKTKDSASIAIDSIFDILEEVSRAGIKYPKIFLEDIKAMAKMNEKTSKIKAPVVLIQGAKDLVSDPKRVIPPEIIKEEGKGRGDNYMDPREEYLKNNLFQNSPYVKMVIAEKMGHHSLPFFRPDQIARVAIGLLERYYRNNR